MAEPALQYDEFEDIEPIEIPAGGIATFLTAREGIAADSDDEIPQGGIAQVKAVADQLAEFGRYEDQYMVHAAHGETVIPMEVFRKNPILKENIYKQMRDMGLEPERYVVGSDFNSINPVTGQPEFFLKKLVKGVKNVFKGVKKVFKVVAPIVMTAVLTPFVGPIAAGAITGGITSLVQGGDLKDALKMAAIGGATAGVFKGIQGAAGAAKSGGNIFTGAKEGFMAARGVSPFAAGAATGPTQTATAVKTALESSDKVLADLVDSPLDTLGQVDPVTDPLTGVPVIRDAPVTPGLVTDATGPSAVPPQLGSGTPTTTATVTPFDTTLGLDPTKQQTFASVIDAGTPTTTTSATTEIPRNPYTVKDDPFFRSLSGGPQTPDPILGQTDTLTRTGSAVGTSPATVADAAATAPIRATTPIDAVQRILGVDEFKGQRDILGGLKDLFLPGGTRTEAEIRRILADRGITEANNPALFKSELVRLARRGLVERALPLGIAALGVSSLTEEEPENVAIETLTENPLIGDRRYSPGTFLPRPTYTIATLGPDDFVVPSSSSVYKPVPGAAQGGGIDENIFPRMNGPIEGPGTETSDDIPAMLSDGEFVMTAKAVRGAGNGSRQQGMRNMYDMMSNFEARA